MSTVCNIHERYATAGTTTTSRFGSPAEAFATLARSLAPAFGSPRELLDHYRFELPRRVGSYHQDEVGPVMHHDEPGEADRFVGGQFRLGEATMDMSKGVDWFGTPNGDLEWNGGLVRQGYLTLLAAEYQATGSDVYAETAVSHMLDYIEKVPPFEPEGKPYLEYKKSTWRPFEAAGRAAETWPEALARIVSSRSMTPDVWVRIMLSIREHGLFLRKHHWKTGNHATLEVAALGILGVFYREFTDAEAWRNYAARFLDGMWEKLFWTDGYSREMSGGYHWVALRSYLAFYEVACENGFADLFSQRYREWLTRTSWAELTQEKPDFSVPVTNDSNSLINRKVQIERIHRVLGIPEFRARLDAFDSGPGRPITDLPGDPSHFFPCARVGIMRSGWGRDDRYLFVDMGRWGDNHMNQDQLHIEVSAFGRNILVGSGRWRYTTSDPSAPWMPWARYFKTTAAYNSVLVDGFGQMPGDAQGTMVIDDSWDFADGVFSAGYGQEAGETDERLLLERGLTSSMRCRVAGATHRRRVFFIKPFAWIVRDEIEWEGRHTAEQVWHFREGVLRRLCDGVFSTVFDDVNLLVRCSLPVEATTYCGSHDPVAGWHCDYYDRKAPAPELRFATASERKAVFHTLLYPYRGSALNEVPGFAAVGDTYRVCLPEGAFVVHAPAQGVWQLG